MFVMGMAGRYSPATVGAVDDIASNSNPFKDKTFNQIDKILRRKGFKLKGPDPLNGKGMYINPKSGIKYYFDKGGYYKNGFEKPHVDVFYNDHPSLEKVRFFLDGGKSWKGK